jgi:hypothetical protein
MEMSSAPDIRRRPHRVYLAPGGKRDGCGSSDFKGAGLGSVKNFYKLNFCGAAKRGEG